MKYRLMPIVFVVVFFVVVFAWPHPTEIASSTSRDTITWDPKTIFEPASVMGVVSVFWLATLLAFFWEGLWLNRPVPKSIGIVNFIAGQILMAHTTRTMLEKSQVSDGQGLLLSLWWMAMILLPGQCILSREVQRH